MKNVFFDSWESIVRSLIITMLAYITLVIMLRVSGKRTLAKMNAFDFVVTIALGSCLATVSLNKNVALADGVLVFLLFILLQYLITWLSVRIPFVKDMVTNKPTLLVYKGEVFTTTLKKERIAIDEVHVAVRRKGIGSLSEVDMIILETTGDITVIPKIDTGNGLDTLTDVGNLPDEVHVK